jgi:hypothetical protein
LEFYIPQIEEWKRQKYSLRKQYETALEEHTKKLIEEFTRLKQGYEESCQTGDREGGRESEGEREERGGHLRELRARVTEGLRGGLADRGAEAVKRAVRVIEQRLKQIPDQLGIIRHEFQEWRGEVWERVTGKPYRPGIEDTGGGKGLGDSGSRGGGGKKPESDRGGGWDR